MAGIDVYTVLCPHFNEGDGSTSIVDSSLSPKTITANGNVQTDSGITKFANTSLHDGTGDYWSVADSSDWQLDGGSDSNTWTIDLWVYFAADPGTGLRAFFSHNQDGDNHWTFRLNNNVLQWKVRSGGTNIVLIGQSWNPVGTTWYHLALVKNGTLGYMHFVDGVQIGTTTTDTSTIPDYTGVLSIGANLAESSNDHNGNLEEGRISKGIARWTANFTPETAEYSADTTRIMKMMLMGIG